MTTTERFQIPEITDERLNELAARIKPVHNFGKRRGRCYVKPMKRGDYLRGVAYTWEPRPADKVEDLRPISDIRTYHTFGYYGFFKPSIAEVLAQIPPEVIDQVVAFEIIDSPSDAEDLNREADALNSGYHVATTRLFARA